MTTTSNPFAKLKTTSEIAGRLAELIGGTVSESRTTRSCYVRVGLHEVRISNHTSYGSNDARHILINNLSREKLLNRLRVATVAAMIGTGGYKQVSEHVSAAGKSLEEMAGF